MQKLFNGIYKDKVVLLTGHTGFKGSWLALWLHQLGAKVVGFSKDIPTTPSHWQVLNLPIVAHCIKISINKSICKYYQR